jgi:hypothetical protein
VSPQAFASFAAELAPYLSDHPKFCSPSLSAPIFADKTLGRAFLP